MLEALQGASITCVLVCVLLALVSLIVILACKASGRRDKAEKRAIRANLKDWKL